MKHMNKLLAMCMALLMVVSCLPIAHAAEVADATINTSANCSLTIYKYDWTNAVKDGVWNEDSFISTGWRESYVEEVLGAAVRTGDSNAAKDHVLGNAQTSNGYAIKGVEFTILRVADIVTFTESANDQHPDYNLNQVLYGFNKTQSADLLKALGLANGASRYTNADGTTKLDSANYYYVSDVIINALADALNEISTTVKDALEAYIAASDSKIVMDETNADGMTTKIENLYVAGEAAGGVHGRNRLMGNSLLDVIVFGRNAGKYASAHSKGVKLGKLTLSHVDKFAKEMADAGVEPKVESPLLLPSYTHGNPKLADKYTWGHTEL
jgi:hypothetical protein